MNESLAFAIKTGIGSGIITAVIIWVVRLFYIKIASPRIEQYFYNGVLLDGTWNGVVQEKRQMTDGREMTQARSLTINLNQRGSKVKGAFYARTETKKNENGIEKEKKEYSNQYKLEGSVIDNYLVLNYRALSRNRTGLGSLVLQITHGGTRLNGGISYVGEGGEFVSTIQRVEFIRSI